MVRRVVVCMAVVAAAFLSAARAEPLDAQGYTRELARALAAALPSRTVTVVRDFELGIRQADGTLTTLSVANLYSDYRRDPGQLRAIADTYAKALSRPAAAPAALDRARIVPVVKDRQWLLDSHAALKARGAAQEHLFDELNGELVIVYAEDSPGATRYLMSTENIGGGRDGLRELATENLVRLLPKIEMRTHDDLFSIVSAGGDYEASLLLIDGIWSGGQIKVDGDIVVAVPAKDVLLITGSRNRKGLAAVRALAAKLAAQERYRITATLFVYRDGRFTKFGRK